MVKSSTVPLDQNIRALSHMMLSSTSSGDQIGGTGTIVELLREFEG
jgi:hypothetical protein